MLSTFLDLIETAPESITFAQTMAVIDEHYDFSPTGFQCGEQRNEAGTNAGSCKILGFGQLHQLSAEQTLHLFGDFYRVDVLQHPNGNDHGNIRNFIARGWEGVAFDAMPLTSKG